MPVPTPRPDPETVNYILNNNLFDHFDELRGAPGICLDPLSWDDIVGLVETNTLHSLSVLGRNPQGIVEYRKFRRRVMLFLMLMTA